MGDYDLSQYLENESELGYGDFIVGRAKCINVLLVGRSQTGKSTIVQTLLNPQKGTSSTGFSDTRDPECNSLILTNKINNESYQLNIIDTPGLKEVRNTGEISRTDEELLKLATKCVENNITSLNVVCFVSRAGDTHRLDVEVFKNVKECLGDNFSKISMMVLTHCDDYSDETMEQFEKNIREHDVSKPYFNYCNLAIVRFGAVDFKKLEQFKEDVRRLVVQSKLKNIEKLRNNFLNKIILCAEGLKVAELQTIYDDVQKEKANLIDVGVKTELERQKKKPGNKMSCVIQ